VCIREDWLTEAKDFSKIRGIKKRGTLKVQKRGRKNYYEFSESIRLKTDALDAY